MEDEWQYACGSVVCKINTAEFNEEKLETPKKHVWRADDFSIKM